VLVEEGDVKSRFHIELFKFASCYIATLVFEIIIALEILTLLAISRGFEFAFDFLTQENYLNCFKSTMAVLSFVCFISSPILLYFCGFLTKRIRIRYAISYALMVLLIGMIFFVPTVIENSALFGVVLVMMLAVLPGFVGGYVRGWMIDHWTGGTRHGVIPA
jgi:hypothetical protein